MKLEDIITLITTGESQRVELKRTVREGGKLAEDICAMANSGGGYIIIGVDDSRNIVGVTSPNKVIDEIYRAVSSIEPPPEIEVATFTIDEKTVVVVDVKNDDRLHVVGGTAYVRVGTVKRPLTLHEIIERASETVLFPLDRTPTPYTISDIWDEAVRKYSQLSRERKIPEHDVIKYLKDIGLIVNDKLTLAAALVFTEFPQHHYPQAYLRLEHEEKWIRLKGPIWKQVDDTVSWVLNFIPTQWRVVGARRTEIPLIPPRAVREAVVNALVHRNYAVYSETFVRFEGGSLIVMNPGSFPRGVTPEDPKPKPRNPSIYELMYDMGYVEKRGIGISMMRRECKAVGCELKIETSSWGTKVVFRPGGIDERFFDILEILPAATKEVATKLGVSKVTALRLLNDMEKIGMVKKVKRGRGFIWQSVG